MQHTEYLHTDQICVPTSTETYWVGEGKDELSTKSDAESQRPRQLIEMWSNQKGSCLEKEDIFLSVWNYEQWENAVNTPSSKSFNRVLYTALGKA